MPAEAATGEQIRTTYLMGTFVFQPWRSKGFFVKASTGMALVRNWVVDVNTEDVFTSKAFALGLGAGWEWPLGRRLAAQAFGSQHVATLEKHISMEGRFMTMILAPVIQKAPAKPKEPRAERPRPEQAPAEPQETAMATALKAAGATD